MSELHCWKIEGPIGGLTGEYPIGAEEDPISDVTIIYW